MEKGVSVNTKMIQAAIEPAVTQLGYQLWGVEYVPSGRHSVLRIYIDSADSSESTAGSTVDDRSPIHI